MEDTNQNAVRSILRSEITWLISFIICIMGFVTSVVMPLQKLQIQLAQIQSDLQLNGSRYSQVEIRLGKLELDHAKMEQVISNLR